MKEIKNYIQKNYGELKIIHQRNKTISLSLTISTEDGVLIHISKRTSKGKCTYKVSMNLNSRSNVESFESSDLESIYNIIDRYVFVVKKYKKFYSNKDIDDKLYAYVKLQIEETIKKYISCTFPSTFYEFYKVDDETYNIKLSDGFCIKKNINEDLKNDLKNISEKFERIFDKKLLFNKLEKITTSRMLEILEDTLHYTYDDISFDIRDNHIEVYNKYNKNNEYKNTFKLIIDNSSDYGIKIITKTVYGDIINESYYLCDLEYIKKIINQGVDFIRDTANFNRTYEFVIDYLNNNKIPYREYKDTRELYIYTSERYYYDVRIRPYNVDRNKNMIRVNLNKRKEKINDAIYNFDDIINKNIIDKYLSILKILDTI